MLVAGAENVSRDWYWLADSVNFAVIAAALLGFYILFNTIFRKIRYVKSLGTIALLVLLVYECGSVALERTGQYSWEMVGEGGPVIQELVYPTNNRLELQEFIYPAQWHSVNRQYRIPFDWDAMFSKQAIWLSLTNNSMFLLQKDFARYARKKYSCEPTRNCRLEAGSSFVLYPHDGKENLRSVGSDRFFDAPVKVTKSSSSPNELKTVCSALLIVRDPEGSTKLPDEVRFRQLGTSTDRASEGYFSAVFKSSYSGENLLVSQYDFEDCLKGMTNDSKLPLTSDYSAIEEDVFVVFLEDPNMDFVVPLESHNPNSIRLLARTHDKSLLLRKENYHPNWNLTVNSAPHKIDRTSENFQIISLDPGLNDLVFSYESIYDLLHKITQKGLLFLYFFMIVVLGFNKSGTRRMGL